MLQQPRLYPCSKGDKVSGSSSARVKDADSALGLLLDRRHPQVISSPASQFARRLPNEKVATAGTQ